MIGDEILQILIRKTAADHIQWMGGLGESDVLYTTSSGGNVFDILVHKETIPYLRISKTLDNKKVIVQNKSLATTLFNEILNQSIRVSNREQDDIASFLDSVKMSLGEF